MSGELLKIQVKLYGVSVEHVFLKHVPGLNKGPHDKDNGYFRKKFEEVGYQILAWLHLYSVIQESKFPLSWIPSSSIWQKAPALRIIQSGGVAHSDVWSFEIIFSFL